MIESKGKGRSFNCAKCPDRTKKLRRCQEDRWDFSSEDNPSVFPIQLYKGGQYYGFCPGKAMWPGPDSVVPKFQTLLVAAMSRQLLYAGGIMDQPAWFIDSLSWFLPMYDQILFMTKARAIIGDGKKIGKIKPKPPSMGRKR